MSEDVRSDAECVAAAGRGDMKALGELVRRHQARTVVLAYRMLGRWDLAEDVAQDAFVRVFRAAPTYRPTAKFTTWLYRVVVNLCLDCRRRRNRLPLEAPAAAPDPPSDPARDPVEAREVVAEVQRAMAALPERQRTAVILHRYEGLSHREIAQATGWSESAVESLLVRGYEALRKALAPLADPGDFPRGEPDRPTLKE